MPVLIKFRERREKKDEYDNVYYSYWWIVQRVGHGGREQLEVTKGVFGRHTIGDPIDLYEYPGTTRLVHRDKLGGRPALLNKIGGYLILVPSLVPSFWPSF